MDILLYQHPTPCWISNRVKNKLAWYLLTVEGWVMAAFVTVSLAYLSVTWAIIRQRNKGKVVTGENVIEELALRTANQQLRFIPVIYVCTRIWGTGYFLFTRYPENSHLRASDWLLILKAFGDNSQGLANAIFFCLATQQIRSIMHKKLKTCCACFSGWCRRHKIIGPERWTAVSSIVRMRKGQLPNRRSRNLDESDLDLSGISLELPPPGGDCVDNGNEDDVIFER
ncbi:unnamed protein product [Lymnaea stagnalis]|uniref:Uncharacterized protein n=1 Tax=Lymnaea stagnalis TaxID=6523 RepID=A0AAV2HJ89_LYMST